MATMLPPDSLPPTSRRRFLQSAGLATTAAMLGTRAAAESGTPRAVVEEVRTISLQPQYYHGWPTVTRRRNGDLVLTVSGGRAGHICPFGRVEMMVSHDQGTTWHWPQIILDSPSDDRDSGVLETSKGTLLATTFTSLAYEKSLADAQKKRGQPAAWPEDKLRAWELAQSRLTPQERKANLGEWMVRSTDGGITWSARYPTIVNSPHGPIQLRDGRLLYAGKQLWTEEKRIGVCQSTDDGASWQWLAEIPARSGDTVHEYHELHAVEAADGRLIAQIRNHNKANAGETLQSESADGGKTWSEPHPIGVWGLPSFLNRLRDGRLLMTYGHRRAPLCNQARLSNDHGRTWSDAMIIYGDGASGDLGYPSTVEFDDGSLLTVWYEHLKDSPNAVLRQARWKLSA
jgi:hypothetical protein